MKRNNRTLTFLQNEVAHITSALNERNTVIGGIYWFWNLDSACVHFQNPRK